MELGLYTFADVDPEIGPARRLRNLLEEIELADHVGLDVFGVGEHPRPDYAASSPAVVLAAAAERTRNIRLTSAVTVLSSDDPVRVFQEFATLDLLSGEPRSWPVAARLSSRSRCSATTLGITTSCSPRSSSCSSSTNPSASRGLASTAHRSTTPAQLPISITWHTYVAGTSQRAGDEYFPTYATMMNRIDRKSVV